MNLVKIISVRAQHVTCSRSLGQILKSQ